MSGIPAALEQNARQGRDARDIEIANGFAFLAHRKKQVRRGALRLDDQTPTAIRQRQTREPWQTARKTLADVLGQVSNGWTGSRDALGQAIEMIGEGHGFEKYEI
ncbi:hypothetical protein [Thiobaca trueperi]|uniref:hypothetical protein n=1 Tax=Thiobaca trueperi TaxID=127458 RepID=UPI001FB24B49|nr:hypothetical protein [Thiobaca trueperi]